MKKSKKFQKFADKFAKEYDKVYSYKEDIEFYKKEALKTKGDVLEIGCGTGRIYLEILKTKSNIFGIDISQGMLDELKRKANEMNLDARVFKKDMRNFNLNRKFSLIIIPFRTFLHNLTIKDQIGTLKTIKKHLRKDGRLILNFSYPEPSLLAKTIMKPKDKKRFGTTFSDKINQIIKMNSKDFWFEIAFIYKREFELLLMLSGFKNWKVYGGFNYQKLKDYNQEMVWVVETS